MKLLANRSGFFSACQLANAAVSPRDVKPVLRNILVRVEGETCRLMATDLEIGLSVEVRGVKVDEPGDILLPADRAMRILRELPDEDVRIDGDESATKIVGASANFELASESPDAFPTMLDDVDGLRIRIASGNLKTVLQRTIFAAASAEHSRFGATTGLLLECDGERLTAVATDGRRLALAGVAIESGDKTSGRLTVIPAKAVRILISLLDDPEEVAAIAIGPNEAVFKTSRATLTTRLVEGRFPDYRQAMPKGGKCKYSLEAHAFLRALRQAAIMTDDESKRVVMAFEPLKVTMKASGSSSGKSLVSLPITGEGKVEISFDPKFMVDFFKGLPAEQEVVAEFTGGERAGLLTAGEDYRYVVVPLVGGVA